MAKVQNLVSNLDGEQIVIELYLTNPDGSITTDATNVSFLVAERAGALAEFELTSVPEVVLIDAQRGLWNIIIDYATHLQPLVTDRDYYYSVWASRDNGVNWRAYVTGTFRLKLATAPA